MSIKKYISVEELEKFLDKEIESLSDLENSLALKRHAKFAAYELLQIRIKLETYDSLKLWLITYNSGSIIFGNPDHPVLYEFDSRSAVKNREE